MGLFYTRRRLQSRRFKRIFDLYWNEGRYLWLRGKPKAARSICKKILEFARLYHLPRVEAMALSELGCHSLGKRNALCWSRRASSWRASLPTTICNALC
jgi:hypothetical protein